MAAEHFAGTKEHDLSGLWCQPGPATLAQARHPVPLQGLACISLVGRLGRVGDADRGGLDLVVSLVVGAVVGFDEVQLAWGGGERSCSAGGTGGTLELAGALDPYMVETVIEHATRTGPGAHVEIGLTPAASDDEGVRP